MEDLINTDASPADAGAPKAGVSRDADPAFEREMAGLLVSALQLETTADEIDPAAPLFGEGLGLDSIDALELSMAVARDYGVELKSDHARNEQIFASLRALSRYVATHRTK